MNKNIIISGLTAAGKTTHSKILSKEFGLSYISASDLLLRYFNIEPSKVGKNFWVSKEGIEISKKMADVNIEKMLLEKFNSTNYSIFDCLSLPYMIDNGRSLNIWIESSVQSRVMKAAVSHGKDYVTRELEKEVICKDNNTLNTLRYSLNDIKIGEDIRCYDVIIDISDFIEEPNIVSSWKSISKAHRILSLIVGYFLSQDAYFIDGIIFEIKTKKLYKVIRSLTVNKHDILNEL